MNDADALKRFQTWVKGMGTQRAAAASLGISNAYLNDILKGRRALSEGALKAIGLARRVTITAKGAD